MAPKQSLRSFFEPPYEMDGEEEMCNQECNRKRCSSSPPRNTSPLGRRVAFVEFASLVKFPALHEMSDEASGCTWLTSEDYRNIVSKNRMTLQQMMTEDFSSVDNAEFCCWGLEGYTATEIKRRRENQERVVRAVLKAQNSEGMCDPVYLAELSRVCTATSREQAFLRASQGQDTPPPPTSFITQK